ncbi:proteoglycan 4 isoform X4 [Lissotriton helveticus]
MSWISLSFRLFCVHVFLWGQSSAQDPPSCAGRCGESYSREAACQCDYNCHVFMECCPDYRQTCTLEGSCKGRCHENFERGRDCDCDNSCEKFDKCCPDYKANCVEPTTKQKLPPPTRPSSTSATPTERNKVPTKKPSEISDKKKQATKPKKKIQGGPTDKKHLPNFPKKKEKQPVNGTLPESGAPETPPRTSSQIPPPSSKNSSKDNPTTRKQVPEAPKKKPIGDTPADSKNTTLDSPSPPDINSKDPNQQPAKSPKKKKKPPGEMKDAAGENPADSKRLEKPLLKSPKKKPPGKPIDSAEDLPEHLKDLLSPPSSDPDGSGSNKDEGNRLPKSPKKKRRWHMTYSEEDLQENPEDPSSNTKGGKTPNKQLTTSPKKKPGSVSNTGKQPSEDSEDPSSPTKGGKKPKKQLTKSPKKPSNVTNTEDNPKGDLPPKKRSPKNPKKTANKDKATPEDEFPELSDEPPSALAPLSSAEGRKSTMKRSPKSPNKKPSKAILPADEEEKDKSKTAKKKKTKKATDLEDEEVLESENESMSSSSSSSSSHQSSKTLSRRVSKKKKKADKPIKPKNPNTGKDTPTPSSSTKKPPGTTPTKGAPPEEDGSGMVFSDSPTLPLPSTQMSTMGEKDDEGLIAVTTQTTTVKSPTTTPAFRLPNTTSPWMMPRLSTTPGELRSTSTAPITEQRTPVTRSTPKTYPMITFTDAPESRNTTRISPTTPANVTEQSTVGTTNISTVQAVTRTTTKPAFIFNLTTAPAQATKRSTTPPAFWCLTTTVETEHRRPTALPATKLCTTAMAKPEKTTRKPPPHFHGIQIVNATLIREEMNLCNGRPVDGMTTLHNGSLVAFRGPYFWMLNQFGRGLGNPRRITDVWGIPSPIDTVFTRCNCDGKTFFFKDSSYWRFTNDVMDRGYPKLISTGFGGLSGKTTAVLSVASYKKRVESVYFFKHGGTVQQYTYKQQPTKKCDRTTRPKLHYPVYTHRNHNGRYRTVRDLYTRRIVEKRIYTNVRNRYIIQPGKGVLHAEVSVRESWRGIPNNIISAVSLHNPQKPDGYDYYAFSKDKYYNLNPSSRTVVRTASRTQQNTAKDWYKC